MRGGLVPRARALAARVGVTLMVMALVLTGSALSATAADEADQGSAWTESAFVAPQEPWDGVESVELPLDPVDPPPGVAPAAGDVAPSAADTAPAAGDVVADVALGPVPRMLPDPDLDPDVDPGPALTQDDSSGGGGSPLTAEQERRLRDSAEFYLRDGSPFGARAYLVKARYIISGGPSTQDWIDAAKFVGGFVVQTSATVVAIAGCPATAGATCLIATALANAGGACIDGCDAPELAVNVVAIGVAAKAGYAINTTGLSRTEELADKLVTDAAGSVQLAKIPFGSAPDKAWSVLNRVDSKGAPFSGYKGGSLFANDGRAGGAVLPRSTSGGQPISYREWDLDPNVKGVSRSAERLVTGSDGTAYYTADHYVSFTQIR